MVLPELKGKGKRIKANLGYWEKVSWKQNTQTQEPGSECQCIFSYIPSYPQQSCKFHKDQGPRSKCVWLLL